MATQTADIPDPISAGDTAPGRIRLCISRDGGRICQPDLNSLLTVKDGGDLYDDVHFLDDARIVRPAPGTALLLLQVASLHSGDNDQRIATALFGYDRAHDDVVQIYAHQTGRNNNQEIRYVDSGVLRGAMIAADPTQDAPFGYWITVDRFTNGAYVRALRTRSATRYGDGNPLAVVDAEMPGIEKRLGLWHAGMTLPSPAGCAHPHLVRSALWC